MVYRYDRIQVEHKQFASRFILLPFPLFGLVISIADYTVYYSPGADSIIQLFFNFPAHKILLMLFHINIIML
jgi:hypothetical protein